MNAKELRAKWRGFNIADDFIGCWDSSAGFLFSEDCITAYKDGAIKFGAEIHENEAVTALKSTEDGVTVETDKGTYQGKRSLSLQVPGFKNYFLKLIYIYSPSGKPSVGSNRLKIIFTMEIFLVMSLIRKHMDSFTVFQILISMV